MVQRPFYCALGSNRTVTESLTTGFQSIGSTSSSLLERVKAHDQDAWRRLARLYTPLALYWCRRAGISRQDRADVLQEVFRAVARNIAKLRLDRPGDSFRAWLRTIVQSKAADHFRRQGRGPQAKGGSEAYQRLLQSPGPSGSADHSVSAADERQLLMRQALRLMKPEFEERTWQAFWRTTVDGLPSTAIAQELGTTAAAVRQAKARVLKRLRQEFQGLIDVEEKLKGGGNV